MAIADMFLKIDGVTGEATDSAFKGAIDVVSWTWGIDSSYNLETGRATSAAKLAELVVFKRVDRATPTLMGYLKDNKLIGTAVLTVRKAGTKPLEYFKIELMDAYVRSVKTEVQRAEATDLMERLSLAFVRVVVTYTPQSETGAAGGGAVVFTADAVAHK